MTLPPDDLGPSVSFPTLRHRDHRDMVVGEDAMGFVALRCLAKRHSDEITVEVGRQDRWVHPVNIIEGRVYDY